MRKPLALSAAIVVSAAGFAGASIIGGGGLAALGAALTGTTGTTGTTVITSTTSTTGGRGVTVCHEHGWRHHHHQFNTIVIDQHALKAHLRHGDHVGPCVKSGDSTVPPQSGKHDSSGKDDDDDDNGGHQGRGVVSGQSSIGTFGSTGPTGPTGATGATGATGSDNDGHGHSDHSHGHGHNGHGD